MENKYKYAFLFLFIFFGCVPSVFISSFNKTNIDKNSAIYISNLDKYSIGQKAFRNKLNHALMERGYFVVDSLHKSKYYLLITFSNTLKGSSDIEKKNEMYSIELLLIELNQLKNHLGNAIHENTIWKCKLNLNWMDYLKHQDSLIMIIAREFMNPFYGRKVLI